MIHQNRCYRFDIHFVRQRMSEMANWLWLWFVYISRLNEIGWKEICRPLSSRISRRSKTHSKWRGNEKCRENTTNCTSTLFLFGVQYLSSEQKTCGAQRTAHLLQCTLHDLDLLFNLLRFYKFLRATDLYLYINHFHYSLLFHIIFLFRLLRLPSSSSSCSSSSCCPASCVVVAIVVSIIARFALFSSIGALFFFHKQC